MAKLLNVNLSNGECALEDLKPEWADLGGRGLSSSIVAERVDPKADALGPDNVFVVAAGILAGTTVPNGGRLSVGAKSPLTGGIKEANSGGVCARKLANLGIRAIAVDGQAAGPSMLVLNASGVTIKPADDLWGLGTYATIEKLRAEYGEAAGIMCCGPAGEMLYGNSAVITTTPDFLPRSASRGGLGAVMGSKKLKAIVIDDTDARLVEVANNAVLKAATTILINGIRTDQIMHYLKDSGTAMLITIADSMECLVTKNYSSGRFDDNYEISGEKMSWLAKQGRPGMEMKHHCMPGCVVHCSTIFTDEKGKYVTSGFEFETLGLMGSNCLISDLEKLAQMDYLCDDIGIDTIETGGAIGMFMEAGILPWGDADGALKLIQGIVEGTEHGKLIGRGTLAAGTALGVKRIPVVKGQCISAWEPRVLKGTGVTYATSPQGADHTDGNALPSMNYDASSPEGQAEVSLDLQRYFAAMDALGMCEFPALAINPKVMLKKKLIEATGAILGKKYGPDYLSELGARVLAVEVDFNRRAGFTREDDRLPAFFMTEPVSPSGKVFDVPVSDIDSVFP